MGCVGYCIMATTQQRLKKWADRISYVDDERGSGDGIFIGLKSGWQDAANPTCHTIHEDTYQLCLDYVAMAVPCGCKDCLADLSIGGN